MTYVSAQKITWLTLEQAIEKSKVEKKKIFIDVYTDWCGWCKHMDRTTFEDSLVIKEVNEHWYAVKFNAEQRKDVLFRGKVYKFIPNGKGGGVHELALLLLQNQMSYPTVVFLDENALTIQAIPGYREATSMEMILAYFGGNFHKTIPWSKFERDFGLKKKPNPNTPTITNRQLIVKKGN